jgi:hypothetical protein
MLEPIKVSREAQEIIARILVDVALRTERQKKDATQRQLHERKRPRKSDGDATYPKG